MNKKIVYLGGPMAGTSEEEKVGWRNELKEKWVDDFFFLDPCDRYYSPLQWRDLVKADTMDIHQADVVLCHMWKPGIGSAMELVVARHNDTPTLVVVPTFKQVSPWVREYADFLVSDFDQAYKILKEEWVSE